ncbi:MAG: type I-B CRISPR-associated endonuclease Cas1b [Candidatus Woesearchaeota archaeon]
MKPLYILERGKISRDRNTIFFENNQIKIKYPIKDVDSIFFLNETSINSKLLGLLSQNEITAHFFGHYGDYKGSFIPEKNRDGKLLLLQLKSFEKRIYFAKEIVCGSIHNMRKILLKYKLKEYAKKLENLTKKIPNTINKILSIEAMARKIYYDSFKQIIKNKDFKLKKRTYNPPKDEINALISFLNTLLYNVVLSEIYKTRLDPVISYVHEPSNRLSLQYDIADIFKPIIVDRLLFTLINKDIIKKSDFCNLKINKDTLKKIIKMFDERLNKTIKINEKESYSYKYLIRRECFKIINHIEKNQDYKSFKVWW